MDLSKKVSFSIHDTFSMVDQESFFLNCKLMRIILLSHWPENAKKYFPGLRAMNIPSLLTKTTTFSRRLTRSAIACLAVETS